MESSIFTILLFSLIFIIISFIVWLLRRKFGNTFPYEKKEFFMTPAERQLFFILNSVYGSDYFIFSQISLYALVRVHARGRDFYRYFARISQKSVDFALVRKSDFSVYCAIELDDASHLLSRRRTRDDFINMLCLKTQIPLARIRVKAPYDPNEIRAIVANAISAPHE